MSSRRHVMAIQIQTSPKQQDLERIFAGTLNITSNLNNLSVVQQLNLKTTQLELNFKKY